MLAKKAILPQPFAAPERFTCTKDQQPKSDDQKAKPFITRKKIVVFGFIAGGLTALVAWNTKSGKETMLNLAQRLRFGGQSAITLNTPAAPTSLMPKLPVYAGPELSVVGSNFSDALGTTPLLPTE